jgi:hypothetical protein
VGFTEPSRSGHAAVRNRTTKRCRDVAVAGRGYFPAPSLTLRVAALAFEVFRRRRAETDPPLRKNRNRADPRVLAPLQSSHCCPGRTRPPLVGFVRRCVPRPRLAPRPHTGADLPSTDAESRKRVPGFATERPLPHASLHASVPRNHPRNPVPSSWSCTTSTVSSARRSRACCIPLPVMGFVAFRVPGIPIRGLASQPLAGGPNPSSRRTSHPPKASSTAAAPRHRGRCPLAVGRRSCSAPVRRRCQRRTQSSTRPGRRLRGVAPPSSLDTIPTVAGRGRARPSMGFVPLQGPSSPTRSTRAPDRCAARPRRIRRKPR